MPKADSRTSTKEAFLAERPTDRSMSYWLERISPSDIGKLWKQLRAYAKAAPLPILWELVVSGIISKPGFLAGVTVYTIPGGFAVHFTEQDTSE